MTVAFVFSGGASLGSIQAGMALALEEAGIGPELILGSSVGAINGAWFAGGGAARGLCNLWATLDRRSLFPIQPRHSFLGLAGRQRSVVPANGIRALLNEHVAFDDLEDADVPFAVIASDARTGEEVVIDAGPAIPALLASSALPGILPPVLIGDRLLVDGGIANNTPITCAVERGASEVWVLSTGYACCGLIDAPEGALAMALHSISLLVQQRLVLEMTHRTYPVPVRVIPAPCPITVGPLDFSQSEQLIERAAIGTRQWLANGCPNAMPSGLHLHDGHLHDGHLHEERRR